MIEEEKEKFKSVFLTGVAARLICQKCYWTSWMKIGTSENVYIQKAIALYQHQLDSHGKNRLDKHGDLSEAYLLRDEKIK